MQAKNLLWQDVGPRFCFLSLVFTSHRVVADLSKNIGGLHGSSYLLMGLKSTMSSVI